VLNMLLQAAAPSSIKISHPLKIASRHGARELNEKRTRLENWTEFIRPLEVIDLCSDLCAIIELYLSNDSVAPFGWKLKKGTRLSDITDNTLGNLLPADPAFNYKWLLLSSLGIKTCRSNQ